MGSRSGPAWCEGKEGKGEGSRAALPPLSPILSSEWSMAIASPHAVPESYDGGKGNKKKGRRRAAQLRRILTPLLLVGSFLLPFSFLLISERGHPLHGEAYYDIRAPEVVQGGGGDESLRISTLGQSVKSNSNDSPTTSVTSSARGKSKERSNGQGQKKAKAAATSDPSAYSAAQKTTERLGEEEFEDACTDPNCPVITGLSVSHGPTEGGTLVTILGENFGLPTSLKGIKVGSHACTVFESLGPTSITCEVPPGLGTGVPFRVKINGLEGSSNGKGKGGKGLSWSYDPPVVSKVEPNHASRKGGARITIRGTNFGPFESHPTVKIGQSSCLETKWISNQAIHCVVPPGQGTHLPIRVTICGCGSHAVSQSSDAASPQYFSYDEDIMKDSSQDILKGIDLKKLRRVSLVMNAQLVNLKYETVLPNVVTGEKLFFAVIPELLPSLPLQDVRERYDTCAVVGSSGSLLDANYGDLIDDHSAVFRLHNAPTNKFEQQVGSKTTYQVLNHFWAGELLKVGTGVGGEKNRNLNHWVHEGAHLVLWSLYSQETYLALKETFPTMSITLLNPQFTQSITSAAKLMQERIEKTMGVAFDIEDYSSTLMSVALAMESCGTIDLYGVDMRYGKYLYYESHEVASSEREASSLEYMIFLVLKAHGHIASINEGSKGVSSKGSRSGQEGQDGCTFNECRMDCNKQGLFVNGTCLCDPIYAGVDCSINKLEQEATKILSGLNLAYNGSIIMNRKEINGTKIMLPEGITRGKFGKDGDAYNVDRMLYHVIPEEDVKVRYSSCAIVGNSGSMLNRDYGHDIDAHEVVYRFNQAPVKGYEKHVGSRSTHESLNGYWVKQVLDERRGFKWNWRSRDTEIVVFELFEPGAFGWKAKSQIIEKDQWWRQSYVRLKQKHQGRKITALSPYFVSWSYQMYRDLRRRFQRSRLGRYPGEKPMSGFYAFFFALQVCDEVDIYGFAPWRDPLDKHLPKGVPIISTDKYHYFDSAKPRPGSHSFDLALYIYKLFAIHFDNVRIYE